MNSFNSFFEDLQHLSAQEMQERSEKSLEQVVVKRLLLRADKDLPWRRLEVNARKFDGLEFLDLAWFKARFPDFPVKLYSARVRAIFDVSWAGLFGASFMKQAWMKAYTGVAADEGWDLEKDWVAMAFTLPHADKASKMIVHNQYVPYDNYEIGEEVNASHTRIVRKHGKTMFVIESLDSFILTVGTRWYCRDFLNI